MAAKYYLKKECTFCQAFDDNALHRKDIGCKGKGFISGADVTKLMEAIQKKFNYSYKDDFIKPFEDLIEVEE